MLQWLFRSLREHPEVALFVVLAIGYGLGSIRVRNFKLGPVLGILIAGIIVGQLNISVAQSLKHSFFMLFLFAIGYQTGPQFFQSLRMNGPKLILLTLVVSATAVLLTTGLVWLAGFDAGKAAGLLAGAMTGSAAFGAAGEAIGSLSASEAQRATLLENAAVSFAVCYLVGAIGVVAVLTKVGPRLMRVDLRRACKELEEQMGLQEGRSLGVTMTGTFETRAYAVPRSLDGKKVSEIEGSFPGYRVFVERLRRNGELREPAAEDKLDVDDHIALRGRRQALMMADDLGLHHELYDSELVDTGAMTHQIVIAQHAAATTLGELAQTDFARGIFLERLVRGGEDLPFTLQTSLEPGDVLTAVGEHSHVLAMAQELGYAKQETDASNMTHISLAICLGALIGLPAFVLAGVEISLTMFVGVLVGGLILGRLGSTHPRFATIPAPALWLFESLGLGGFLALVGLQAGPGFIRGLQQSGPVLVGSAVLVVVLTHVVGILTGRYLLRMHPGVVLGACAGAGTSAPALRAVLESADSHVPALSYGIGYALGNVMLAVGAAIIVRVLGTG
jgi:putative transport protein